MLFKAKTIVINPLVPTKQCGFLQQTSPIFTFHDDLHARILFFQEKEITILVSLDNIGMPLFLQTRLQERLQVKYDLPLHLVIACTHTHFGADSHTEVYLQQVEEQLFEALENVTPDHFDQLSVSYQSVFFDGVGKCRISNYATSNIFLDVVTLFSGDRRLATVFIHNAHPTILSGDTPYFSAEYPGYVIDTLLKEYAGEFFTFFQGAAGDVSSRFTRKGQDYDALTELGDAFVKQYVSMRKEPVKKEPLTIRYEAKILPMEHQFDPIDLSNIPDNISDRERETIAVGVKVRENLASKLDTLPKEVMASMVDLHAVKLIFMPNELFSCYISAIDKKHSCLICYANGYAPYVTGVDMNILTYERFTDTLTRSSKESIFALLQAWGG